MEATRIFIVEDETTVALYMAEALKRLGYSVCGIAASGKEALEKIGVAGPDLVLMDIVLKGEMDGIAVAGMIRADRNIPVIYLTAYGDDATLQRAKLTEPFGYIIKPFQERDLHIAIEIALYKHRMETKLRKAERWLATTLKSIGDGVIATDRDGTITFMNPMAEFLTGWQKEEAVGKKLEEVLQVVNGKTRSPSVNPVERIVEEGLLFGMEPDAVLIDREGREIHIEDSAAPIRDDRDEASGAVFIFRDGSERYRIETLLKESENKYHTIFDNAVEGIFQTLPEGRFISANPAMAHIHGFSSPEEMCTSVTDIRKQFYVNPEDRERYAGVLEERGVIEAFEAQVYRKDGSTIWTSTNARAVRDAAGKIIYFEGFVEDITSRKHAGEELKQTLEKLRKSLTATIEAMSVLVEIRDPYTAGHQRRVTALACAIAEEMGFPGETIETIRVAASIHDIGKMSVPAEILSKPTRLSDIERSLIQVHPQAGYDILKDVALPSPVAEIVLQHHERLDGSGYPRGLRDGEILPEACVVVVADVVEAISSHRPYRPALGIDAALEEIRQNRGSLYDGGVVDACLKLFSQKAFRLE
jgi:PAS domain S-box-containing protein/putative nucleotidyltransferase with HDIG domain